MGRKAPETSRTNNPSISLWGIALASDERGTKRTCPVTGKKFYDLNKDPVISPYTGKSYPFSFFEAATEKAAAKFVAKKVEDDEDEDLEEVDIDLAAQAAGAEVTSLDDAEDPDDAGDDIPDVDDVAVDVEDDLGADDDDTFLETDDEDDDIDFDVAVDDDER